MNQELATIHFLTLLIMKKLLFNLTFVLSLIFLLCVGVVNAKTYETMMDGSWTGKKVWTVNGSTSCGCAPGSTITGDTIIIRHHITSANNFYLFGDALLLIGNNGNLDGFQNLETTNAKVLIYGVGQFGRVQQFVGSSIQVHSGTLITTQKYEINEGELLIYSSYVQISGNFTNYDGNVEVYNFSRLDTFGSYNNHNYTFIETGACVSSEGAWNNYDTVDGGGSVTSYFGSLDNNSFFSSAITWCALGGGLDMPTPPNCATTLSTCNGIVLPIELVEFTAENHGTINVNFQWVTATEKNASHFNVLKLNMEEMTWELVATVQAKGNSTVEHKYTAREVNYNTGVEYYKLEQVALDGTSIFSDVASVDLVNNNNHAIAYPNPSSTGENIIISNIAGKDNLKVYDMRGQMIYNQPITIENHKVINSDILNNGVYLVEVSQGNETESIKVVVVH